MSSDAKHLADAIDRLGKAFLVGLDVDIKKEKAHQSSCVHNCRSYLSDAMDVINRHYKELYGRREN